MDIQLIIDEFKKKKMGGGIHFYYETDDVEEVLLDIKKEYDKLKEQNEILLGKLGFPKDLRILRLMRTPIKDCINDECDFYDEVVSQNCSFDDMKNCKKHISK